jgi:hypothetical protein
LMPPISGDIKDWIRVEWGEPHYVGIAGKH